ncbi:MAG: DUF58 domain-containing protein [Candidatus Eremiobacteraeota bacterium]|nr:DUF58 domain-containing protein [Candidatus Eremiobacteraeota bacterium]
MQRFLAARRLRDFYPAFPWVTSRCIWAIVLVALLVGAGALLHVALLAGYTAAMLLLVALALDLALGPKRRDIVVAREPVEHLALRKPGHLRYSIINRTGTPLRYAIVDTPVATMDFPEDAVSGVIGSQRSKLAQLEVMPRARGAVQLGTLFVSAENPVGLIARRWKLRSPLEARVYPDLSAVERYGELARRGRLIEAGFRKLRRRGRGGEFDALREWTPDDEFRSINWKATARRAKLMVEQYDVERSQTVMLVLDAGRLMTPRLADQRKFDFAVTAALSVASIASLAADKVGLLAFAGRILEHIPPRTGTRHANGMTQRIYDLQPRFEEADYAGAFGYLRRRQTKRSLVIFFTDMFDPVASAASLAHLTQLVARHLVVCVLMNDEAIESSLGRAAHTGSEAYEAGVAAALLTERRKTAAVLRQLGVSVIDVPAKALTVSLINAYIEIKAQALL